MDHLLSLLDDDVDEDDPEDTSSASVPATPAAAQLRTRRRVASDSSSDASTSAQQPPPGGRATLVRLQRAFKAQLARLRRAAWGDSFGLLFMFIVLFILEAVATYGEADSYVRQFKTVVPYATVSWVTIQLTRLAYGALPESLAAPVSLYLSFVPFPMFTVFSRENHNFLPTLYLVITLSLHARRLPRRSKRFHYRGAVLLYLVLYLLSIWFMFEYFVDTTGLHRFYGRALEVKLNVGDELTSILTALLVSTALWVQDDGNDERAASMQAVLPGPQTATSERHRVLSRSQSSLARSLLAGSMGRQVVPYESLSIDENDLIGRGTYGNVYRSVFENDVVAVKKINESNFSVQEADILNMLSHKHVIRFKGIAFREPHDIFLVLEYAERGSLYDYLADCRKAGRTVDFASIKCWSKQIAQGMLYLHTGAPRQILHRDLKSKNILLDKNLDVKISDFGWSRTSDGSVVNQVMTNSVGTCAWMAPEVIRGGNYSETVDVWSFGVVLWEMVTGQVPYEGLHATSIMFGVGRDPPLLELPIPDECPEIFRTVMLSCWQRDPTQRPRFLWLHRHLTESLEQLCNDTYNALTINRQTWGEQISQIVRSQQLRVAAELSIVDARKANVELAAKEARLSELEERLHKRERSLHKREKSVFIALVLIALVLLVFLAREFVVPLLRQLLRLAVNDVVGLLSTGAHEFLKWKERLL